MLDPIKGPTISPERVIPGQFAFPGGRTSGDHRQLARLLDRLDAPLDLQLFKDPGNMGLDRVG